MDYRSTVHSRTMSLGFKLGDDTSSKIIKLRSLYNDETTNLNSPNKRKTVIIPSQAKPHSESPQKSNKPPLGGESRILLKLEPFIMSPKKNEHSIQSLANLKESTTPSIISIQNNLISTHYGKKFSTHTRSLSNGNPQFRAPSIELKNNLPESQSPTLSPVSSPKKMASSILRLPSVSPNNFGSMNRIKDFELPKPEPQQVNYIYAPLQRSIKHKNTMFKSIEKQVGSVFDNLNNKPVSFNEIRTPNMNIMGKIRGIVDENFEETSPSKKKPILLKRMDSIGSQKEDIPSSPKNHLSPKYEPFKAHEAHNMHIAEVKFITPTEKKKSDDEPIFLIAQNFMKHKNPLFNKDYIDEYDPYLKNLKNHRNQIVRLIAEDLRSLDRPFTYDKWSVLRRRMVISLNKMKILKITPRDLINDPDIFTQNPFSKKGTRELITAIKHGEVFKFNRMILMEGKRLIYDFDNAHMTPLHWAAKTGQLQMAQTLLDLGADLEAKDMLFLVSKCDPWTSGSVSYKLLCGKNKYAHYILTKARLFHITLKMVPPKKRDQAWAREKDHFYDGFNSNVSKSEMKQLLNPYGNEKEEEEEVQENY